MRIAHAQLESRCGQFDANLAKVQQALKRADRERIDIISFPECFLTGYPDQEHVARRDGFSIDSPQVRELLDVTQAAKAMFIVGFNEVRGDKLYNSAAVVHQGKIIGSYSKCSAYLPFYTQGRSFPVFEHQGVKFGVIICSDGAYIEPTRILAAKGAKIVFAPHYNCIDKYALLGHFMLARADHAARAVENRVYFVRGNSVGLEPGTEQQDLTPGGVSYGDSYVVDPYGEIVVRSRRGKEDFIFCDIDPSVEEPGWKPTQSLFSFREFGLMMRQAMEEACANESPAAFLDSRDATSKPPGECRHKGKTQRD